VVSRLVNPYLTWLKFYFSSYPYESWLQSEAALESFFLVVLYDDDKEELTELINLSLFYLFLSIFVVHLYKYSYHYLSFLDTSRKSTSAVVFLSGRFLFDLLNLISSILLEDKVDLSTDLFTVYAILWGKYVLYLTFVLEEFARVGLALFVTYLIIFEINTLNRSYNESSITSNNK
jgi:hypothetical protein